MNATLDQIKELRDRTGIATMACKKALDETGGDIEKAIELLRKKGEIKSAERSDRVTSEGVIAVSISNGKASIVKLACETDFVARNDDFVQAGSQLAARFLESGKSLDVSAEIADLNIKMGEKVSVEDVNVIEAAVIGSYIHSNKKIGVLIGMSEGTQEQANDVAMHVAASKPSVISPTEISDELVAKEKEIWAEVLRGEGKPEAMFENIMKGKEKKFREENALLTQAFVKNPDQTVQNYIGNAQIVSMVRFAL